MRRFLALALALTVGCAEGSVTTGPPIDGPSATGDGGVRHDGAFADGALPDGTLPQDAMPADAAHLDASGDAAAQTDGQQDGPLQADAQHDTAVQQDTGPECTTQNLLVNGSFDVGPGSGWTAYSDWAADAVIYGCASLAHGCQGGSHAAWLGGGTSGQNYVYQRVTVPATTTSLRLTGYRWIDTAESGGVHDQAWIELHLSSDLSLLETLATYSNANAAASWAAFSLPAASTHAGQTIDLLLDSWNDGSSVTSFYLDTLVLEAVVCQ